MKQIITISTDLKFTESEVAELVHEAVE